MTANDPHQSSNASSDPNQRLVGHAERMAAGNTLTEALGGGYLDLAEYDRRLTLTDSARTHADIREALRGLEGATNAAGVERQERHDPYTIDDIDELIVRVHRRDQLVRWSNVIAGIVLVVAIGALIATIALRGGSTQESETPTAEMNQSKTASATSDTGASFADGVFETVDVRIKINEARKIEVGAPGNEYDQKPVFAFWYDITNKTGEKMTPLEWIYIFTAIQDNDPNAINQLGVGSLPDPAFLESQTEEIKPGGTVSNAIAYKLDDETTPIELVASVDFGSIEIGRQTFQLQ